MLQQQSLQHLLRSSLLSNPLFFIFSSFFFFLFFLPFFFFFFFVVGFSLTHYAGTVSYDGFGFLEKNRDTLAVDVIGCFRLSENSLVKDLFGGGDDKSSGGGAAAKKKPQVREIRIWREK